MKWLHLVIVAVTLVASPRAQAVQPDEILANSALEARARALSKELRCMVCQNQSIDDLDAPLARDLRVLVRERLQSGDSDRQVIDYLVARYGEFVLLKPRFSCAHRAVVAGSGGNPAHRSLGPVRGRTPLPAPPRDLSARSGQSSPQRKRRGFPRFSIAATSELASICSKILTV